LRHASGLIVTCNIMDSEVPLPLPPKVEQFFPYRGRTQRLAIYRV
jgi:hypothetical protein